MYILFKTQARGFMAELWRACRARSLERIMEVFAGMGSPDLQNITHTQDDDIDVDLVDSANEEYTLVDAVLFDLKLTLKRPGVPKANVSMLL